MNPTAGDPSVRSTYLSVALISALFQSCWDEEIFIPFCYPAYFHGWHVPWDFIFRTCVIWYLWYLCSLDSQPCPHWTALGSGASIALYSVLEYPILVTETHPLSPFPWGAAFVGGIFSWHHSGSRFLICFYVDISTALPWWCVCLMLKFGFLLFKLDRSYRVL